MATTMTSIAFFFFLLLLLLSSSAVLADNDNAQIPSDKSQLAPWFRNSIQKYKLRRTTLDPALVEAEDSVKIIKVSKSGGGNFNTVMAAVNSVPAGNTRRPEFGTVDSATLIVESDYFMAVNIIVINSSPRPDGKKEGSPGGGTEGVRRQGRIYNCRLIGFRTPNVMIGAGIFSMDATLKALWTTYLEVESLCICTELHTKGDGGFSVITAQARNLESEDNGYSFVHCTLSGTGGNTFLGRAWMSRPKVVFSYTFMSPVVSPLGWSNNIHPERESLVFYGEYKCMGPGADTSKRSKFTKELDDDGATPFITLNYIDASTWLLPPRSCTPLKDMNKDTHLVCTLQ
ncbi:Pectinesterase PPME1 [Vitis vinifera]|uniref:pectinesterase n=1 Tax=Vitis vinifera TaxID=29760 RepID=A0A438IN86_VITVI|nr:Pectinesterase PPME1 [Vitis vinifera]